MFPFSLFFLSLLSFPLIITLFSFLFQSVKILRLSILWRVAEIVENKFLYKNIKTRARKTLIKSRGEISTQIYFPIICLYMHTLLCGKKTPDHKPRITSEVKKDKRNNRKLLTSKKQCYMIQSSARDKRNKTNKKHNFKIRKMEDQKMRKWLNVELNNVESEAFRGALKANKIKYEASNCGYGLTHFEVFVNTSEVDILEGVLSTL